MKTYTFTIILMSFVLSILSLSPPAFSDEPPLTPENFDPNLYHLSEDGQIYLQRPWEDRTGWSMGKIHPDLDELDPDDNELRILIQLTNQPLSLIARQEKQEKQKQLDILEADLRDFVSETVSNEIYETRDEEVAAAQNIQISEAQMAMFKAIHEETDIIRDQISFNVTENVKAAVLSDQQFIISLCNQLGGVITGISELQNNIGVSFSNWDWSILTTLAQTDLIDSISLDTFATLDLDQSACMLDADFFWTSTSGPFDGYPWDFGLLDSEVRDDHIYLLCNDPPTCSSTRPIYKRYNTGSGSHGTQTAGVVCSTHSTYTGIAYGTDAIINAQGHNNLTEAVAFENQDWVIDTTQHGSQGPEVINNSYSFYWKTDVILQFANACDNTAELIT